LAFKSTTPFRLMSTAAGYDEALLIDLFFHVFKGLLDQLLVGLLYIHPCLGTHFKHCAVFLFLEFSN